MDLKNRKRRLPPQRAEIAKVRLETDAVYLSLCCPGCNEVFEVYQPTVAGVAIGKHHCRQCLTVSLVTPEIFVAALKWQCPTQELERLVFLSAEATRLTETWYWLSPFAQILSYKGVNLAEAGEWALMTPVLQGLSQDAISEGDNHDT